MARACPAVTIFSEQLKSSLVFRRSRNKLKQVRLLPASFIPLNDYESERACYTVEHHGRFGIAT